MSCRVNRSFVHELYPIFEAYDITLKGLTHEFKAEAVKLVLNQGLSLRDAAKRLSIPKGTLTNWVSNAKGGVAASAPGANAVELSKIPV